MQKNIDWQILNSADDIASTVWAHILNAAKQAIAQRGAFKLVLAGGTTPEKIYHLLAQSTAQWDKWFIYYGDERCLPADNKDRNSVMAQQTLLNHVPIPTTHIFTMSTELGNEAAALAYRPIIATALPFDMVLLGMGEDGHTASLFPNQVHNENELVHAVYDSPKPPPERVSLSAKVLSDAHEVLFLITGANKQEAVQAWLAGENLPIAAIEPPNGLVVYMDKAAYGQNANSKTSENVRSSIESNHPKWISV